MIIGTRIKDKRKELGLSAEQLAEAINVSPATVYRYESGDIEHMGIDKVSPIARFLHTNEAFLMGWIDDPSPYALRASSSSPTLTTDEKALIGKYRDLNDEGKEILLDQADTMVSSGKYIKSNEAGMVEEKERAIK